MKAELVFTVVIFGFIGYKLVAYLFDRFGGGSRPSRSHKSSDQSDGEESVEGASTAPAWSKILGVSPHASEMDIKAAYRSLMSKYHPDKVESLGDEFKEIARSKSQEINAAYDQARRDRGFT